MTKALFFDIDGTLVSFQTHRIPSSAVQALRLAKAKGVKLFIATGRPISIITNLGQIEDLIDGYVTTNGAFCFVGSEEVCCYKMKDRDVMTIVQDADREGYPIVVVTKQHALVYNNRPIVHEVFEQQLAVSTLRYDISIEQALKEEVLQMTPFVDKRQEAALAPRIADCTLGRWHPAFIDITARGIDKALGLQLMAQHEGFDISETMAFGDGGNDIPMLKAAGVGVALGNALDEVKQIADHVTTPIDEDGVWNALKHYHVI